MKIKIAVPREAKAGDKIRFQSPVGQTCEIVVPKGLSRGFFTGKRVITVSFSMFQCTPCMLSLFATVNRR